MKVYFLCRNFGAKNRGTEVNKLADADADDDHKLARVSFISE